jgi:hypothetical protein
VAAGVSISEEHVMPDGAGPWQKGRFAMLCEAVPMNEIAQRRSVKPAPGDIGVIEHVNTTNGEAHSCAMRFRGALWVIDVKYLEHE